MIALSLMLAAMVALSVWSYRKAVEDELREAQRLDADHDESDPSHAAAMRMAARLEAYDSPRRTCGLCDGNVDLLQLVEFWDDAEWLCCRCTALFVGEAREAA